MTDRGNRPTIAALPVTAIPRFVPPCAALLALACSTGPAPIRGDVHVFVFEESVPTALFDGFHAETGVTVQVDTYDSNEDLLAALEKSPGAYDLVMPSDYAVDALVARDALRPLDLAAVPNYANISPQFLTPWFDAGGLAGGGRGHARSAKYSLPWLWGTTGIAYDRRVVTPPPTHWADVWNPAWAGKVVAPDDPRELLGAALMADGKSKNASDGPSLEAAAARAATLAKGAVALDANTPEAYLADGRAVIGIVFSGNAALAKRANPDIAYVLPEEGGGIWFDNLAIPAGAPNPDAAAALLDYLLRAESGLAVIRAYPFSSPNEAALDALHAADPAAWSTYTGDPTVQPPADVLAKTVPVKSLGAEGDARVTAAWSTVLAARGATP